MPYIVRLVTDEYSIDREVAAGYCPVVKCCERCDIAICDESGLKALEEKLGKRVVAIKI